MRKSNVIKMKRRNAELNRYIEFSLGANNYAIPFIIVKEIISFQDILPRASSISYFVGDIELRGNAVPVIDLRKKLNILSQNINEEPIIIVNIEGTMFGLVVDSISKVIAFSSMEIYEASELENYLESQFIIGLYKKENITIQIFDIEKALDSNDWWTLEESKKAA